MRAKTKALSVRVTPEQKAQYEKAAAEMAAGFGGTTSDVLRMMVIAFAEGRVTIEPRSHM